MKIRDILKEKQPKEYKKLDQKPKKNTSMERREEKLSTYDIEELMGVRRHRYKKHHGATRQL